jgi:hypothetical protein
MYECRFPLITLSYVRLRTAHISVGRRARRHSDSASATSVTDKKNPPAPRCKQKNESIPSIQQKQNKNTARENYSDMPSTALASSASSDSPSEPPSDWKWTLFPLPFRSEAAGREAELDLEPVEPKASSPSKSMRCSQACRRRKTEARKLAAAARSAARASSKRRRAAVVVWVAAWILAFAAIAANVDAVTSAFRARTSARGAEAVPRVGITWGSRG